MDMLTRRPWLAWASVSLLALLCGVLAFLQYRWVGEIAVAERSRLREQLQNRLTMLSRSFNDEISNACAALIPTAAAIDEQGRERAYAERYRAWRETHEPWFRRIGLAVPGQDGSVEFLLINLETGIFTPAVWPPEWATVEERLTARDRGPGRAPDRPPFESPTVIEVPRFANRFEPGAPPVREAEWLIVELNLDYIRASPLPEYFSRYLGDAGRLDYEAQVVSAGDPSQVIYSAPPGASLAQRADASVPLLDVRFTPSGERGRGRGGRAFRRGGPPPPGPGQGRWLALVRHRAGSLDALVARTRRRNLAVSGGVLLLILATVALLVRFSRRAQQLAHLQMNFVAGVSHELRTPLTVIRTAAYNLRGRLAQQPAQVERYGALIQRESERLEALVEQVLRFASVNAGHVLRAREPVAVADVIEDSLRSSRASVEGRPALQIERHFEPDLPLVLADETALRHAIQNLIDNAVKYGIEGSNWIGVSASTATGDTGPLVEVRVADRGPGIPQDEQDQLFEPFFRGRRAIQDQVHGTGLGLSLVKKIIEAHGGTIQVKSRPMQGTEFIIRIPAAPPELQDEFAHTPD